VIEFVFMLTHHDQTVDRPLEVLKEVSECGLTYVGFKDIGAEVPELTQVCAAAHDPLRQRRGGLIPAHCLLVVPGVTRGAVHRLDVAEAPADLGGRV